MLLLNKSKKTGVALYALLDPDTREVRYIGYSVNPRKRMISHRSDKSQLYKARWFQSVCRRGKEPIMSILCVVQTFEEAKRLEVALISLYKRRGARLTNSTTGGDGAPGWEHTPEWAEKMRAIFKGRTFSPETIERMRLAAKKRMENRAKYDPETHEDIQRRCLAGLNRWKKYATEEELKEVRRKAGLSNRGRTYSDETIKKMSIAAKNRSFKQPRPTKLKIIQAMSDGATTAYNISSVTGLTLSVVHAHLIKLEQQKEIHSFKSVQTGPVQYFLGEGERIREQIEVSAADLASYTDSALSKKMGVSASKIRGIRAKTGIPQPATDFPGPKNIDWDSVNLGEEPDERIAKRLGCSKQSVIAARQKRGILSYSLNSVARFYKRRCEVETLGVPVDKLPE